MEILEILEEIDIVIPGELIYVQNINHNCIIKIFNNGINSKLSIDNNIFDVVVNKVIDGIRIVVKESKGMILNSIFYNEGTKFGAYDISDDTLKDLENCLKVNQDIRVLVILIMSLYERYNLKMDCKFSNFLKDIYQDRKISEFEKEKLVEFLEGIKS